jgi:hypothetical protein
MAMTPQAPPTMWTGMALTASSSILRWKRTVAIHQVEETGKDSYHNSGPTFDGGTTSSDCNEASKNPVHGVTKITEGRKSLTEIS